MLGNWESARPLPDGCLRRISISRGLVAQNLLSIRRGRYRLKARELQLSFEDPPTTTPIEEDIPIRFECASLILEESDGARSFASHPPLENRVDAPIVGRWGSAIDPSVEPTSWEFRPDGTFQKETFRLSDLENGGSQPRGNGLHVEFRSEGHTVHVEDWLTRMQAGHLWITVRGETAEYKRVGYF